MISVPLAAPPARSLSIALLALAVSAGGCRAQATQSLVISSDPELGAMAAELLPDLAARAGMELREPVRLESRTRAELVDYLQGKINEELPEDEAKARRDAYALLGLLPADLDLRQMLLELYTEQVAGFYEPDSAALFVMDDQASEDVHALLMHELVHAVQDQNVDLDALTDPDRGNDRSSAAQAAIEGQATLVMLEYATEQMTGTSVDLGQVPDFGAQIRPALQAMNSQFPALASAPRVIRESLLFPYIEGAGFVQRLWADGQRSDPFGDALPLSTEQILRPLAAPPVELDISVSSGEIVLDDVLGRLELGVLMEDVLGVGGGGTGAAGGGGPAEAWDGDRFALVEGSEGRRGLVWATVWESVQARARFLEAVDGALTSFGGEVAVELRTIDDRAVSLLRIGSPDVVGVDAAEVSVALHPSR
ncbi:MAG: hypothetical protein HKN72_01245 [Gemmatimonadetes bacterium]|nr:hypothetical protein [Gemmatimonadota bacterium]NNF11819.1 hypothetical protein [Gemmatimonadota bacterium]NNL30212.1 hypothetical protein [Gemmatimonadota bacterium]